MNYFVAVLLIKFIIRCMFYFYMIREYGQKIIIPLFLYGVFELSFGYIDIT